MTLDGPLTHDEFIDVLLMTVSIIVVVPLIFKLPRTFYYLKMIVLIIGYI